MKSHDQGFAGTRESTSFYKFLQIKIQMNRHLYHEQPSGLPHHPIPNFQVLQKSNVTYLSFNFLLIICIHTAPWLTITYTTGFESRIEAAILEIVTA